MIKINLIPREARPDRTVYYQLFLGAVVLAVTLVIVFGWWMKLNEDIEDLNAEIKHKQAELKKLEHVRKKVKEFEEKKALLLKKKDTIINLQKIQKGPVLILMELNAARPQNQIWFTDVIMQGDKKIKLRGKGLSYSSIGDFMNALEKKPIFENVKLENSMMEKSKNRQIYKFSIHFNIVIESISGPA